MNAANADYVYGMSNGSEYISHGDGDFDPASLPKVSRRTHWDPRIEVKSIAGCVQVGVIPPSEHSTDDGGIWNPEDGQFLSLTRDGLNRLIESLQEQGLATFGRDRW